MPMSVLGEFILKTLASRYSDHPEYNPGRESLTQYKRERRAEYT